MRLHLRCIRDEQTRPSNVRAYTGDLLDLERLRVRASGKGLWTAFLGKGKRIKETRPVLILFVWTRKPLVDGPGKVRIRAAGQKMGGEE
jgi:hypothetical protein